MIQENLLRLLVSFLCSVVCLTSLDFVGPFCFVLLFFPFLFEVGLCAVLQFYSLVLTVVFNHIYCQEVYIVAV